MEHRRGMAACRSAVGRALPGDARALAPTWSRAGESVAAAGLIRRTYSASECSLVRLLRWRDCSPLVRMPSGEAWPGVAAVGPRASRRQFGARDGAPRHGSVVDSGLCGGQARHRCVALRFGVAVSRSRRLLGRRHRCGCHARTPATPNLSARNAGDAEPGDVEPREAGPACVWTGPAGQDGSWWERAGAPRQKPSRAPERGPVRSTGTRLRALVFHVEHRADGRVPTGAPPTARDAQPSPPRCRLCVTSVTARTRLRPTRPVLGRRPSGAEPVVVRI